VLLEMSSLCLRVLLYFLLLLLLLGLKGFVTTLVSWTLGQILAVDDGMGGTTYQAR